MDEKLAVRGGHTPSIFYINATFQSFANHHLELNQFNTSSLFKHKWWWWCRMRSFRFVFLALVAMSPLVAAQLTQNYYASICPNLENIVRGSVQRSMQQSPISAPATLRLFFHDCAVQGCDASILIINPNGDDEWRSTDNQSLKPEGFLTVMAAKAAVDSDPQCKNKVSCADILALATRDSVFLSGGPNYAVELGRFDSRVSTRNSVNLPHGNFNLDQLTGYFGSLGLSPTDMIALSGGHTIGAASCGFFGYRLGSDPTMDPNFVSTLRGNCAAGSGGFAFLDAASPLRFDNAFYQNLRGGRGLLGSDQILYSDPRSRSLVDVYAGNQGTFFTDFVTAMTKLGRVGVKSAGNGEIRRDCRFPN
ncbi:peroxidase 16-like [Oryza brachyantha]|uniref:Peroxidase n=1 Tax=Oryza brachyantha TaxID=4533 RepID=J3MH57_ORYBR|nr:peroxidase 16-like [Oryza brachyantha]